ncbi:hypothetical protein GS636_20760 [Ruegeria sp. HKCCD4884]|uniref:hypothetical protein n=1 Tax=Ruegeria sp. HKCCD4884 TaxID=2683022 RepID=UPI001490E546|nr:hypothetical protein [Ruegeria sp. HKCCD4884]NOD95236.1 hypothetical protein [Ruegeria sp. HKCCD4884]
MTAQLSRLSFFFGGFWWPLFFRVAFFALLAGAANLLLVSQAPYAASISDLTSGTVWSIAVMLALYVLLLSVPFVPGAEIGLALLVGFGAVMAWPVYVATVLALSIAFGVGRLASQFQNARVAGAADPASDALARFGQGVAGRRWLQRLRRFRWLAIALLINMPGNTVIGGGGGIAMAVGYSRAFPYLAFLACSAVAVAPVPAMVLLAEHFGFGFRFDLWLCSFTDTPTRTAAD